MKKSRVVTNGHSTNGHSRLTLKALRADAALGSAAAAAVAAEMLAAGWIETRSPWTPINAVSPILMPRKRWFLRRGWDSRATPLGLAILLGGVAAWGTAIQALFHALAPKAAIPRSVAAIITGALAGGGLAVVDFGLLPARRKPRLARWLSTPSIAGKYLTFALAIALPLMRRAR
jgi:hypothetical protein